jgi:DNA-binding HxlR family transcriptional regulator
MDEKTEKEFLQLIGLTGGVFILRYLNEHETGQYKDLMEHLNTHTLNQRLRTLLHFKLIEHYCVKIEKKTEWYKLTDKGKHVLMLIEKMIEVVE